MHVCVTSESHAWSNSMPNFSAKKKQNKGSKSALCCNPLYSLSLYCKAVCINVHSSLQPTLPLPPPPSPLLHCVTISALVYTYTGRGAAPTVVPAGGSKSMALNAMKAWKRPSLPAEPTIYLRPPPSPVCVPSQAI